MKFRFDIGDRVDCLDYHGPLGASGTVVSREDYYGQNLYKVDWDGNSGVHTEVESVLVPLSEESLPSWPSPDQYFPPRKAPRLAIHEPPHIEE
jgi:hypothetical protein